MRRPRASQPESIDGAVDHLAHDLVAGDEPQLLRRQFAFDDVQIGTAHATGAHPQQDVPDRRRGFATSTNLQRTFGYRLRSGRGWRLSWGSLAAVMMPEIVRLLSIPVGSNPPTASRKKANSR